MKNLQQQAASEVRAALIARAQADIRAAVASASKKSD